MLVHLYFIEPIALRDLRSALSQNECRSHNPGNLHFPILTCMDDAFSIPAAKQRANTNDWSFLPGRDLVELIHPSDWR